ncbi:MAG: DinB family protein [Planctomycetota bacterium]
MDSIDLIHENLRRSESIVLSRVEDMRDHCFVSPTSRGGCHTLWILGHLAFIEGLVIFDFMRGEPNPLSHWQGSFDGEDLPVEKAIDVTFDQAIIACRDMRSKTISLLETLEEPHLDRSGTEVPEGAEHLFGTYRRCFQYVADHWLMHRGQLADARRAAGISKMWY